MLRKIAFVLSISFSLTLFIISAQAQESRFLQPTASLAGNTGLWKVLSPDTLPPKQASFAVWYDRIGRNPGQLTISTIGVSGATGLTNWLEFGANFEINRRVLVRRSDQLSLGQQQAGLFGNRTKGAAPLANELMPGTQFPQLRNPANSFGRLSGAAGYYNMLPFATNIQGNGIGTLTLGLKANILSEANDAPLSFGVRWFGTIPTKDGMTNLQAEPTQTGTFQQGFDLMLAKGIGDVMRVYLNGGYHAVGDPDEDKTLNLSNVVPLSFGMTIPRDARVQFMHEITADLFVGGGTQNTSFGAEDPMDVTVGFRAFLNRYLALSAGYRAPLSQFGGDKNGFVITLSYNYGPPYAEPIPAPPTLTCSANPTEVQTGESIRLSAQGNSPSGAALTYQWSSNGGTIEGSGADVQLRTIGLGPGTYTATVRVVDTANQSAECSVQVRVATPPPPPPPTVACSVDRSTVRPGEIVTITARGQSSANRPLTYTWATNGGRLEGTGSTARLDTTNLYAGTFTVKATVVDDIGQSADCSSQITVEVPPPPPPPQPVKLDQCSFRRNSSRVDNVCKAILDNAALRLQSESDATLSLIGFAESNEQNSQRLSQTRAENVRTYLVRDKGLPEARIQIGTGSAGTGAESRRVEIHLIPRGAGVAAAKPYPLAPVNGTETRAAALPNPDVHAASLARRTLATAR
ncbi:MAG: hypothetical protein A3F68_13260 [Acidobacteria bacterium RIFCSPLOWO2_12_FULL_54_10]|nr:MAG: hypothetical protein A3F68_13260 [Acidobacteria bacterium RIFCSPLOWO2_12_FULL_54_10]